MSTGYEDLTKEELIEIIEGLKFDLGASQIENKRLMISCNKAYATLPKLEKELSELRKSKARLIPHKRSDIGELIKEALKEKGVTQQKAAEDLGIGISTFRAYCQDYRNPDIDTVMKICSYCGATLNDWAPRSHYISYILDSTSMLHTMSKRG